MTDIAKLGFEIDTSPLASAARQAQKTAEELGRLGDAADRVGGQTGRASSGILEALVRIERALTGISDKMDRQAGAQRTLTQATEQGTKATQDHGAAVAETEKRLAELEKQLADANQANKAAAAAARQATAEAKAQAEQEKRLAAEQNAAAAEAKRQAEETRKLTQEQKAAADAAKRKAAADAEQAKAAAAAKKAEEDLAKAAAERAKQGGALGRGFRGLADELKGMASGLSQAIPGMGGLLGSFGRVVGAAGPLGLAIGGISASLLGTEYALAKAQDHWAKYEGQLRNTLGSTVAAREAIDALYKSAQGSGISFDSTVEAFNRMARNANDLGASNADILRLTETIQKLGVVSNASQGEISSGMLQLSQALSSGRLNGDELRSIMEQMPALAKAIADGLGVSVGQLRAMGANGELTGDKVFRSILQNTDKVNAQFRDMPDTTERAFQRVSDSWSKMLAQMGESANSSSFIQGILNATNGLIKVMSGGGGGPRMTAEATELAGLQSQRGRVAQLPGAEREGSDTWRRLQTIDAQIAALQPKVQAQTSAQAAELAKAREDEAARPAIAVFGRGSTIAKESKTLAGDQRELSEQIFQIENALIAAGRRGTPSTLPADQQPSSLQVEQMESALVSLKTKLADTTTALAKFTQGTSEYREALNIGGTGGGVELVKQAQDLAKQMRAQGVAASTSTTLGAVVSDRVARSGEEAQALDRQTEAQKKLAGTVGATRDAVRETEIAQAAYDYRVKTFGSITGPGVEKAVAAYTDALRRNKQAQDALADSRAFQAIADQIAVMQAGADAMVKGSYAMRQAEAQARAAQADRQTPGLGAAQMRLSDLQEQRAVDQQLEQLRRQAERNNAMAGARSYGEQRRIGLQQQIEDAARDVAPDRASDVSAAMRKADESEVAKSLNDQKLALEDQIAMQAQQLTLVGKYGEELAAQQAMLAKRAELIKMGADPTSEQSQGLIDLAGKSAREGVQLDKAQQRADQFKAVWDDTAQGISSSISDAFLAAFDQTKKASDVLRQGLSDAFSATAKSLMNMAIKPLQDALSQYLSSGIASLFPGFGGGGGAATIPMQPGGGYALGGAFGAGGAHAFAKGGTFTNSVVSSPTMFRFANGGAMQTGLMGEAGPEAIMPLRRGADGRLGVSAGGGGGGNAISITVNVDASGAQQTQQTSGSDADNRGAKLGELVASAVKNEINQQQRPGGLLSKRYA